MIKSGKNEHSEKEQTKEGKTEKENPKNSDQRRISVVSLMFFVISFLGWCMETVFCSEGFTSFPDRGFLTLPFCVIYGAPVCLIFLILGTPKSGFVAWLADKIRAKKAWNFILRYTLYFFLSAAIATLFELIFGWLYSLIGVTLWTYRRFTFNYRGYICLEFTLIWGVLITLFMSFLWRPMYRLLARIPFGAALTVNLVLWVAVSVDFAFKLVPLLRQAF